MRGQNCRRDKVLAHQSFVEATTVTLHSDIHSNPIYFKCGFQSTNIASLSKKQIPKTLEDNKNRTYQGVCVFLHVFSPVFLCDFLGDFVPVFQNRVIFSSDFSPPKKSLFTIANYAL
jgi:hypothetical protein